MHDAPDLVDSYLDLINLPWQNIKKKNNHKVTEEKAYILHVGQGHLSLTRYLRKSYMALVALPSSLLQLILYSA